MAYAFGPIGSALLGFITLPLITWFYSVEDVGRIAILQVFASLAVIVFSLGLDQAYVRDYYESKNKNLLFKLTFTPGFLLITVVFISIFILHPSWISIFLFEIDSWYLSLIVFFVIILSFSVRFLSLVLRMQELAFAFSLSQVLPKFLFLIFIFVSVYYGFDNDTNNIMLARTLSITSIFLMLVFFSRKQIFLFTDKIFSWHDLKPKLAFGGPLVIGGLASWGLSAMDKIFIKSLSSLEQLGIYSVALSIAGVATIFSGIFNTIWSPLVFKWINEGVDTIKINTVSEHVLAAIYFSVVLCSLFSWLIPLFLPDEYLAVKYLFISCLLGPLFYTLSETTSVGISISRRTSLSMLASLLAVSVNAIGNFLLVPSYGALGASFSTAISFWFFYIFRTEFSSLVWRSIPRIKSYTVTFLLIFSVIASVFILNRLYYFSIWVVLLLLGFVIFRNSLYSFVSYFNKKVN